MIGIALIGPDRVGKTTLISKAEKICRDNSKSYLTLHFSGPQPNHKSLFCQYKEPFEMVREEPDVVLFDRFISEAVFYEHIRRGYSVDDWVTATREAEEWMLNRFNQDLVLFYIQPEWEEVRDRHLEELWFTYGNSSSDWYIKEYQLNIRKREHDLYKEFMKDYWNNVTTLPVKHRIQKLEDYKSVLQYLSIRVNCVNLDCNL